MRRLIAIALIALMLPVAAHAGKSRYSAWSPACDEIQQFVDFYFKNADALVKEVGYIPLPPRAYSLASKRFIDRKTGSVFAGKGSKVGVSVEDLLAGH